MLQLFLCSRAEAAWACCPLSPQPDSPWLTVGWGDDFRITVTAVAQTTRVGGTVSSGDRSYRAGQQVLGENQDGPARSSPLPPASGPASGHLEILSFCQLLSHCLYSSKVPLHLYPGSNPLVPPTCLPLPTNSSSGDIPSSILFLLGIYLPDWKADHQGIP